MPKGLTVALLVLVASLAAADVNYINEVPYTFPDAQGAADQLLTNDGAGTLSWADAPSPEGLWTGCVVLSTVACPAGWTEVSAAAADRELMASGSYGVTGGSDTHTNVVSGSVGTSTVSTTGNAAAVASLSISGSTQAQNVAHTHTGTIGTTTFAGGSPPSIAALSSISPSGSSNPIHSHAVGSLGMSSHAHASGTLLGLSHAHPLGSLAADAGANVPLYYTLRLCQKD